MWKNDEGVRQMIAALGPRLAYLRRQAGLTQDGVAARMGLSSPNHRGLCRLESGRTGNPGLASVAQYLRACRADFHHIVDILDGFTRRQTVSQVRAQSAIAELEQRLVGEVRIGTDSTTKAQRHKGRSGVNNHR